MTMSGPISTSTNPSRKSKKTGAIVGGVIGTLVALAVIGIGAWIILRRRTTVQGDHGYSEYARVSSGAPVSEQGQQPSQLRLYVRPFVIPSRSRSDRRFFRTRTIQPPTPLTPATNQVGLTRQYPAMVVILVSRNCEKIDVFLFPWLGTSVAF